MKYFQDYVSQNYLTLMLLFALAVVQLVNLKNKIKGAQLMWVLELIVLALTICEYVQYCTDTYEWSARVLYYKSAFVYWLFPLIALIEFYLITPFRKKIFNILILLPYIFCFIVVLLNLFGYENVFAFTDDRGFVGKPLRPVMILTTLLYILVLMIRSLSLLRYGRTLKLAIVAFITFSSLLAAYLELRNIISGYSDEIAVINMFVYYFYLAAIYQHEVHVELFNKTLEYEKTKLTGLMAQIRPHFINNSMAVIQELCYEDPERAAEMMGHFGVYLRDNFTAIDSNDPVPFEKELDMIKEFVALEHADPDTKFVVDYELEVTEFMLPPLSVEPLVENALKHGIDRYKEGSRVIIRSYRNYSGIVVEIRDNGQGFEASAKVKLKESSGIGTKNAATRLKLMCGGTIQNERVDGWTIVKVLIPNLNL